MAKFVELFILLDTHTTNTLKLSVNDLIYESARNLNYTHSWFNIRTKRSKSEIFYIVLKQKSDVVVNMWRNLTIFLVLVCSVVSIQSEGLVN